MVPPKMRHWGPSEDAAPALSRKSSVPAILAAGASDRKSTRLNSSHLVISYAVFCLKKKPTDIRARRRSSQPPLSISGPPGEVADGDLPDLAPQLPGSSHPDNDQSGCHTRATNRLVQ